MCESRNWYTVRSVYRYREQVNGMFCYEEIANLWLAESYENSFAVARNGTFFTTQNNQDMSYIGRMDSFELYDTEIESRTIAWSFPILSNLTPPNFIQCFFDNELIDDVTDEEIKLGGCRWFSSRALYLLSNHDQKLREYMYEEKVVLFLAESLKDAQLQARADIALYEKAIPGVKFLGRLSLEDIGASVLGHGTRLWSIRRKSSLDSYDYVKTFIDIGNWPELGGD